MQIILDLSDKNAALLEKAVVLENQQRRKLSIEFEAAGNMEASELFRKDLTLNEYALATLLVAAKEDVGESE